MRSIKVLPENVANQIAAGEVIERPASVVRELIDNSIDAGADKISIRIEEGGKRLIRVNDNGMGMDREDMLLSIERHATSKIQSISDIFAINTLGFRGEALPSICSVSKVEMTSRIPDEISACRVRISGGVIESVDEAGAPAGTTVEVRDLYFNTPARKKFLKSDQTETGHIVDTVSRIALPFTKIQIQVKDTGSGRTLLNLPSSESELNRLSALFGKDIAVSLLDAYFEQDGLKIRAYLSPPESERARGDRIYVYVNNRNVRDKLVLGAITRGYGQRLMKGRYPQVALFMDIDPALVDVNVHPAKQEVRFEESGFIYKSISSAIARALGDQLNPFSMGIPEKRKENSVIPDTGKPVFSDKEKPSVPAWEYSANKEFTPPAVKEERENYKKISNTPEVKIIPEQKILLRETPQIIGRLKNTYLLLQDKDGLLMIDQHAAHERIVYETLKNKYSGSRVESQSFLLPVNLELSLKDAGILEKKVDQLLKLGFEIENFGGTSFLIRSVPAALINSDWEEFLSDLIPVLEEEDDLTTDKAMDKLLTVMACHGAIRAGHRMSDTEIAEMIEQLEKLDLPTNCPHGRPVFRKFSYREIEKMFKRIV